MPKKKNKQEADRDEDDNPRLQNRIQSGDRNTEEDSS